MVVAVACAAIAVGLTSTGGSPPTAKPPSVPPVQPAARDFAEFLTTYPGSSGTYQAYQATLGEDVIGAAPGLVTELVGLGQPPSPGFSSQGTVTSTAVVQSSAVRAELDLLVSQTMTEPYRHVTNYPCRTPADPALHTCSKTHTGTKTATRVLLIDLTMVRTGQKWLVSEAKIELVSPASGALAS